MRTVVKHKAAGYLIILTLFALLLPVSFSFAQDKHIPKVSNVSTSCAPVGTSELTLIVTGSNFDTRQSGKTDARFRMVIKRANGTTVETLWPIVLTETMATFKLPASVFATTQILTIEVQNANGNSGNYQWESSTPINFYVMGPTTTTSGTRCGTGSVTLQASGAPVGTSIDDPRSGYYLWYNSPIATQPVAKTTTGVFTTPSLSTSTPYYVQAFSESGCSIEGRKEVTATVTTITETEKAALKVLWVQDDTKWQVTADGTVFGAGALESNATYAWYRRESSTDSWGEPIPNNSSNIYFENSPGPNVELKAVAFNSQTCTQYTLTNLSITPLPVEIIYFRAARQGKDVHLSWATAMEKDNSGFEVEVSEDGKVFRKLAFVGTRNGNTQIKQSYIYTDTENGKYGTRYYRLKQLNTNGTFEYLGPKSVTFEAVAYKLSAFPNPFWGTEVQLAIQAEKNGRLQVLVTDAMGKRVAAQSIEVARGLSMEPISLAKPLPKGIYFVRTEMSGSISNFKLLKE